MLNILEEYYKTSFLPPRYNPRKLDNVILKNKTVIKGITNSGKTYFIRNYLQNFEKNSFLYIDLNDARIDFEKLPKELESFCKSKKITTLILDSYQQDMPLPKVESIIIVTNQNIHIENFDEVWLHPLDYEEFLSFEHKFDSSALNHYLQIGGFLSIHRLNQIDRVMHIQKELKNSTNDIELDILKIVAKYSATKISPYNIYEKLKQFRKISKDKTYQNYKSLADRRYILEVEKFEHKKATKKLYLADTFIKTALTQDKNFARLFENVVFLELYKKNTQTYYMDDFEFYLPKKNELVFTKPFADESKLFKKLYKLEAFIINHQIKKITVITISKEDVLSHPFAKVELIPFDIWALGEDE